MGSLIGYGRVAPAARARPVLDGLPQHDWRQVSLWASARPGSRRGVRLESPADLVREGSTNGTAPGVAGSAGRARAVRDRALTGVERTPGRDQVQPLHGQVRLESLLAGGRRGVADPDRQCVLAVLAAAGIKQAVPGDSEQPGPGLPGPPGGLVEASPRHQERLGDRVLSVTGMDATLREAQHVAVGAGEQRAEPLLALPGQCAHIPTCPAPPAVCRPGAICGLAKQRRVVA